MRLTGWSGNRARAMVSAVLVIVAAACSDGSDESVEAPAREIVLSVDGPATAGELENAAAVVRARLQALGHDATVTAVDDGVTVAATEPVSLDELRLVVTPGKLALHPVVAEWDCDDSPTDGADEEADATEVFEASSTDACYRVEAPVLTGADVAGAAARLEQGAWLVDLELVGPAEEVRARVWQPLEGRALAIVVDGRVVSAAVVNPGIVGDAIVVVGDFTEDEARALAATLDVGEGLPVALVVPDEREAPTDDG